MHNVMKGEKSSSSSASAELIIHNLSFYMYATGKYNMKFLIIIPFALW